MLILLLTVIKPTFVLLQDRVLDRVFSFDWSEIIQSAKVKSAFNLEDLVVRLKSFPIALLDRINLVDDNFLNNFTTEFADLIEEISDLSQHTSII